MTYDVLGPGALDYLPCRYGASKLLFRGPERALDAPYVAFLGGIQTYGKFIEQPYPLKVEHLTGVQSVNLGLPNAGVDVFANDPVVHEIVRGARACVVEVLGAANMSNRFYRVHPRRNDRFLDAAPQLQQIYPEVDFADFNFTQHMLGCLYALDPERFKPLRAALQRIWLRRMRRFLETLEGRVVLLWMERNEPPDDWSEGVGQGPVFVTRPMLDALSTDVSATVIVPASPVARAQGTAGMLFNPLEEAAARQLPGPQAHAEVARALMPVLDAVM